MLRSTLVRMGLACRGRPGLTNGAKNGSVFRARLNAVCQLCVCIPSIPAIAVLLNFVPLAASAARGFVVLLHSIVGIACLSSRCEALLPCLGVANAAPYLGARIEHTEIWQRENHGLGETPANDLCISVGNRQRRIQQGEVEVRESPPHGVDKLVCQDEWATKRNPCREGGEGDTHATFGLWARTPSAVRAGPAGAPPSSVRPPCQSRASSACPPRRLHRPWKALLQWGQGGCRHHDFHSHCQHVAPGLLRQSPPLPKEMMYE